MKELVQFTPSFSRESYRRNFTRFRLDYDGVINCEERCFKLVENAERLSLLFLFRLRHFSRGDEEANLVRKSFINRSDFAYYARDIEACGEEFENDGHCWNVGEADGMFTPAPWMLASLRTAARRAGRRLLREEEADMSSIPGFGIF